MSCTTIWRGKSLLPEEQKGCRRKSRGTKDQLLIEKMVIRNCKRRQTGLGKAWVEYKRAYDMIWSSDEYDRLIGKKYGPVESGVNGRRTDLGYC